MRALPLLLLVAPAVADAQSSTATAETDGAYSLEEAFVASPPLNRAACTATAPEPIIVELSYALAPAGYFEDIPLRVWRASSADAACTGQAPNATDAAALGEVTLSPSDPFFLGTDTLRIPHDLEDATGQTPELTATSVLTAEGGCGEAGLERTITLCMALDENKDGTIEVGDTVRPFEPRAWVRLRLDTIAPPRPTSLRVTPREASLRLTATMADEEELAAVSAWRVYLRERPTDDAAAALACDAWPAGERRSARVDVSGDPGAAFSVSAENGVTYQVCVAALDQSDNEGPPSEVVEGTPQVECDFVECYPDDLLAGGCATTPPAPAVAALLLPLLVRRRARRREERTR